jgi:hypothetical protein
MMRLVASLFLMLVFAAALPLALPGTIRGESAAGDDLHKHIAKLGGKIERNQWQKEFTRYNVSLRGLKISDADLAPLAKSQEIETLDLALTPITDAAIEHINAMAALNGLDFTGTKITDLALAKLRIARKLYQIDLGNTLVTAKGVQDLVQKCQDLTVGEVAVGDKSQYRVNTEYRRGLPSRKTLMVGDTHYGFQFTKTASPPVVAGDDPTRTTDLSRFATTYYHRAGPVGQVMSKFAWFGGAQDGTEGRSDARVPASIVGMLTPVECFPIGALSTAWSEPAIGVVRITAGTHAAYVHPYQHLHVYNSTPELTHFSVPPKDQPRQFDFIHDARQRGACVQVVDGDERTQLAKKGPKNFYAAVFVEITVTDLRDINIRLFTKEAIAEMMASLAPGGLLCFHTSHRYHNMVPPLVDAAQSLGLAWKMGQDAPDAENTTGLARYTHFSSQWVMIARQPADLARLQNTPSITWSVPPSTGKYLWRDAEKIDLEPLRRQKGK